MIVAFDLLGRQLEADGAALDLELLASLTDLFEEHQTFSTRAAVNVVLGFAVCHRLRDAHHRALHKCFDKIAFGVEIDLPKHRRAGPGQAGDCQRFR